MSFVNTIATPQGVRNVAIPFTATIFLSAGLLFFVQPLFAKIVVPAIGGSPAVWATAMLFFQSVLLLGYLYAHLTTRYLPIKAQYVVHLAIWALALTFLPPSLPEGWQLDATQPIAGQTLWLFAIGVGVPFALLSSNAPLIQAWYARSGGPSANDPYFLYAASNLGSMIALLAFPLIAEPWFGAPSIAVGFAYGFVALGAGLALGGGLLIGGGVQSTHQDTSDGSTLKLTTMLHWGVLAFVPSSLMLAVTTRVTTDIGAVPLVWVIPLGLYLLSFVLTFRQNTVFASPWFRRLAQMVSLPMIAMMSGLAGVYLSPSKLGMMVLFFLIITVWAHRALYELRPSSKHLTVFYVVMSLGGAAGGLFNSILAPVLFSGQVEGALTMIVALLLLFSKAFGLQWKSLVRGSAWGLLIGLAMSGAAAWKGGSLEDVILMIGIGVTLLAVVARRVDVIAVGTMLTIVLPILIVAPIDRVFSDRSFFGVHQVYDRDGIRTYSNGTTIHGAQRLADLDAARPTPLSYYHPAAPMGQVMRSDLGLSAEKIGIVGLGVGALTCYASEGQDWHLYEIDALVDQVARDPELFTFVSTCAPDAPTHLGDARVVLEGQDGLKFDILVIDAYSSDSVPVHLTTLEAMELYLDRLTPDGVLIFHISNRYYDVGLPLARSAQELGLHAWRQFGSHDASDDPGYERSDVALISREPDAVAALVGLGVWEKMQTDGGDVWTDDKANPLSILKPGALWKRSEPSD